MTATSFYFSRLLDIVRRPEGMPLLTALSQAEAQLAAVFKAPHAVAGENVYQLAAKKWRGTPCALDAHQGGRCSRRKMPPNHRWECRRRCRCIVSSAAQLRALAAHHGQAATRLDANRPI